MINGLTFVLIISADAGIDVQQVQQAQQIQQQRKKAPKLGPRKN